MISAKEAARHLRDVTSHYEEIANKRFSATAVEKRDVYVRLRAAIFRLAPTGSEYEKAARDIDRYSKASDEWKAEQFAGIAGSLYRDFKEGYIAASFAALIHADVFGDFLDMSEHLLAAGYKDPAAVLSGAVLEEHLRKLCQRNGIDPAPGGKPKKADALNAELAAANVYSKLDQKNVTAWQDLRNKAAHGKFGEYTDAQVDLMVRGLRDFVARLPA